jgi:PadR family transcriptional regulator PadR
MDAQFKKGVLEMCILHLCAQKDMYGYEMMKRIKSAFPDVYDGSVYAILRRLQADGYAETYFGQSSEGPRRKYYRITDSGRTYLQETVSGWQTLLRAVRQLGIDDD